MNCPGCGAAMKLVAIEDHHHYICLCGGTVCLHYMEAYIPRNGVL